MICKPARKRQTDWAVRKRKQRLDNVQKLSSKCPPKSLGQSPEFCPTDIRDIEKDKYISPVGDTYCPVAPDTPHPKIKNLNEKAKDIIDYLNAKLGTKYKAGNRKTLALIKARMSEGFTVEDFKTVIDKKTLEWAQEANMCQYLRPVTLFSNKFESYLNQPSKNTANEFANFEQRDWDWEKIDEILAND